jgi:cell shape-determining protein MreC
VIDGELNKQMSLKKQALTHIESLKKQNGEITELLKVAALSE